MEGGAFIHHCGLSGFPAELCVRIRTGRGRGELSSAVNSLHEDIRTFDCSSFLRLKGGVHIMVCASVAETQIMLKIIKLKYFTIRIPHW